MLDNYKAEIESHYLDEFGFVTVDRDPTPNSTGNGFLHLGVTTAVLSCTNQITSDWIKLVQRAIDVSLAAPSLPLINRNPWKGQSELSSWDEYLACAAMSKLLHLTWARDLYEYGTKEDWYLDNMHPNAPKYNRHVDSWQDRFPGLVQFYKVCADIPLTFVERVTLAFSLIVACFNNESDANMREYLKAVICVRESGLLWLAARIWIWRARAKWVTLGAMLKPYFGETHPNSRLPWFYF